MRYFFSLYLENMLNIGVNLWWCFVTHFSFCHSFLVPACSPDYKSVIWCNFSLFYTKYKVF